jgi:hypothetical protein
VFYIGTNSLSRIPRRGHHRANPIYLDGNHLLRLRIQSLVRLARQLPVARLAIVGSAGRKTCRTGRLWSWAFPARSLGLATAAAQDTVKLRFRACERVLANGGADETLGIGL